MDILYLVPTYERKDAENAIDSVHNAKHVKDIDLPALFCHGTSSGDTARCLCISSTRKSAWRFTLSNERDGADIYLPPRPGDGLIKVIFTFAINPEKPTEPPNLFLVNRSDHVLAAIQDDFTRLAPDNAEVSSVKNQRSRCLRNMSTLILGKHGFHVYTPRHLKNPAEDIESHLRDIAVSMNMELPEASWAPTGISLGKGAFGEVSLVRGLRTGRLRAMKTIRTDASNQVLIGALHAELALSRCLQHSNIVTFYDSKMKTENFAMAVQQVCTIFMKPYIGSLRDLLEIGHTGKHLKAVATDISSALAYLHENKVIHRDIKPENIMIDLPNVREAHFPHRRSFLHELHGERWTFHLADFGLSRQFRNDLKTYAGTPGYMAPEVQQDCRSLYSTAADVYSLGVVLAEILLIAGEYRNLNKSLSRERFHRALTEAVAQRSATSIEATIIEAMLSDKPDRRPSAEQLVTAFSEGRLPQEVGKIAETQNKHLNTCPNMPASHATAEAVQKKPELARGALHNKVAGRALHDTNLAAKLRMAGIQGMGKPPIHFRNNARLQGGLPFQQRLGPAVGPKMDFNWGRDPVEILEESTRNRRVLREQAARVNGAGRGALQRVNARECDRPNAGRQSGVRKAVSGSTRTTTAQPAAGQGRRSVRARTSTLVTGGPQRNLLSACLKLVLPTKMMALWDFVARKLDEDEPWDQASVWVPGAPKPV